MFSVGDKIRVKLTSQRSIIRGIQDQNIIIPGISHICERLYYLKGFSNLVFSESELELDIEEIRNCKLDKIINMLKYGDGKTYQYKLDDERLRWLTSKTNRSAGQTQFLFNLVDGDFSKLKKLEEKIKNTFSGCPGDLESMNAILGKEDKTDALRLNTL